MKIINKKDRQLVEFLAWFAVEEPDCFMRLLAKAVPHDVLKIVFEKALAPKKPRKRKARK